MSGEESKNSSSSSGPLSKIKGEERSKEEILSMVTSLENFQRELQDCRTEKDILEHTELYLFGLELFEVSSFQMVSPSDFAFETAICSPVEMKQDVRGIIERETEEGRFAWALHQSRPVVFETVFCQKPRRFAFHSLTTRSTTLGMFAGVLREDFKANWHLGLSVFSLFLVQASYAIENRRLLSQLEESNRELQISVDERTKALTERNAELKLENRARTNSERALQIAKENLEIANYKLRKAKENAEDMARRAESASKAKSGFLALVSHEIRTPLNGVIGMNNLLLDTQLSAEQQEYSSTVRECANTLLAIINDILDYSKVEAGKLSVAESPFAIQEVFSSVIDILGAQSRDRGVELLAWVDPSIPIQLTGDPVRLKQVLINLVGNALKFTESGYASIRASLLECRHGEATVSFEVEDSGIGIREEDLSKLFQPFTQVDDSTTRRHGGTGLGLAISQKIVKAMGGRIHVDSSLGKGTRFWFHLTLPLAPHSDWKGLTQTQPLDWASIGHRHIILGGMTPILSANFQDLFQRLKAKVHSTSTVEGVVEALQQNEPCDLLILDASDPSQPVSHYIDSVRSVPQGARVPILLLIGSEKDFADWKGAAGLVGTLLKPIRQNQLLNLTAKALAKASPKETVSCDLEESEVDPHQSTSPLRALVADDNPSSLKLTVLQLQQQGVPVKGVLNGVDALRSMDDEFFNVLFIDCDMPHMDGFEVAAELRRISTRQKRTVYVTAITANAMPGDRERCLKAGMDDYLAKPVFLEDLRHALDRACKALQIEQGDL